MVIFRIVNGLTSLTDAAYFTRDLINEPVNHLNATALAGEIKKIGDSSGFKVEVLNKGKIEALKMGGLTCRKQRVVLIHPFSVFLNGTPENCLNKKSYYSCWERNCL